MATTTKFDRWYNYSKYENKLEFPTREGLRKKALEFLHNNMPASPALVREAKARIEANVDEQIYVKRTEYNAEFERLRDLFRADLYKACSIASFDVCKVLFGYAWSRQIGVAARESVSFWAVAEEFTELAELWQLSMEAHRNWVSGKGENVG